MVLAHGKLSVHISRQQGHHLHRPLHRRVLIKRILWVLPTPGGGGLKEQFALDVKGWVSSATLSLKM